MPPATHVMHPSTSVIGFPQRGQNTRMTVSPPTAPICRDALVVLRRSRLLRGGRRPGTMRSVRSEQDRSFARAVDAHPELISRFVSTWGERGEHLQVEHAASRRSFHVIAFDRSVVARVVTAGLGACLASDYAPLGLELLVVIGRPELSEIGAGRVRSFVADIAIHLLQYSVRPTEGSVMPKTSIAPWEQNALIFDTPRGEPESLEQFVADGRALRLVWAIPTYEDEAALVQQKGMGALDPLVERTDYSLADVRRPNLAT